MINIKRRKKKKEGSDFERKRVAGEKGKEEEEKWEKNIKGRRREVEEISLKGNIYGLKCINVFFFCFDFQFGWRLWMGFEDLFWVWLMSWFDFYG